MPSFALYYYPSCLFCRRVLQAMASLGIEAELRNIHQESQWSEDLLNLDGRRTVPVLRMEYPDGRVEWMRESSDIVRYLQELASS